MLGRPLDFNLITTKLMRPLLPRQLVERPRLYQQLKVGINTKLALVSSPAGSGKSTLLTSWLEGQDRSAAWLSLDTADNDLARFVLYLVSALQQVSPELGTELKGLLQPQSAVQTDFIVTRIINDLAQLDQKLILVLDDYHLISNATIHELVDSLLDHLPPTLCLVIATRSDPPLALSRLRVRGQLLELRTDHLRFSRGETAQFLNERRHLDLSNHAISSLEERTEGWIAGLQLAALSLEGRNDKELFVQKFAGSYRYLVDYLMDEVLERQPPEVQRFLLRTSILERFTVSLCQSLNENQDSLEILKYLLDANLFLIALDDEGRWYRYHHLFAEFLRHRLGEAGGELASELHGQASLWYETQGWLDEAINHALSANDLERAGYLVQGIAFSLQNTSNNLQLVNYVAQFPLEMLLGLPKLAVYFGWALVNTGQTALLAAALPMIERSANHAEQPHVVTACVTALKAFQHLWQMDFATGITLCQDTIAILSQDGIQPSTDEERWLLTAAHNLIAYCHFHSNIGQADMSYPAALALSQKLGNYIGAANDFARYGWIKHQLGQPAQALKIFQEGFKALKSWRIEDDRVLNVGELHLNLSQLFYEQNQLEEAEIHLRQAREFNKHSQFPTVLALEYEIAFKIDLAHGRIQAAKSMLDGISLLLDKVHPLNYLYAQKIGVMAQQMRLHLHSVMSSKSNFLADVKAWVEEHHLKTSDTFNYPTEAGHLVLAQLLLAQGKNTESLSLLERLSRAAQTSGRVYDHVRYLNLQTLAEHKLARKAASQATLRRAMSLAEPRGYCRSFIDHGVLMRTLLEQAARQNPTPYVAKLLSAFPGANQQTSVVPRSAASRSTSAEDEAWVESLNEREVTILRLLSAGHSNKSMAKELGVSPNTIKWYLKGLFDKLDSSGRMQAVSRAKDLGLL